MAIKTKKMQTEMKPVLETAFERMGIKKRTEELWDILDEIEFEKELELSEAEAEQGKVRPLEDALKDIKRKI
jgi:predicted nuclease with TOPRIM domain